MASAGLVQNMEKTEQEGGREGFLLPFPTGRLSDDFTLNPEVVGHGQFGVVKPCVHLSSGQVLACKTVRKLALQTKQQREGLRTEVAVMRHLAGHPNVVALAAAYEDADSVQLVMEFCSGGDLFDLIAAAKVFREPEAAWLFRKIVSAVDFCHRRGVVHRDIKPENILLSMGSSVEPKLADFGLAVVLPPGHYAHGLAGSPFYMAPEVIKGQLYGPAADVWSCGVLLYIMLSGVLPFWGSNPLHTFGSVCRGQVDLESAPWDTISPKAKALVASMLSQDACARPTTEAILLDPWLLGFGPGPVAAPGGSRPCPGPHTDADVAMAAGSCCPRLSPAAVASLPGEGQGEACINGSHESQAGASCQLAHSECGGVAEEGGAVPPQPEEAGSGGAAWPAGGAADEGFRGDGNAAGAAAQGDAPLSRAAIRKGKSLQRRQLQQWRKRQREDCLSAAPPPNRRSAAAAASPSRAGGRAPPVVPRAAAAALGRGRKQAVAAAAAAGLEALPLSSLFTAEADQRVPDSLVVKSASGASSVSGLSFTN